MKSPDKPGKKKKKFKVLTKENLLRPKKFTLRNYNRFISQFIDKYNWGCTDEHGHKSFRYSTRWLNEAPYKSYVRLREKYKSEKYYDICLDDHLKARQDVEWFVHYTSKPSSDLCLLTGDIDAIDEHAYDDCLQAYYYIENKFHPDTYFEPSISGSGVHFYTIIDFSSFPKKLKYNGFNRDNCNEFIAKYSNLMSDLIDSMYYCHFDKFSGTYPIYDNDRNIISRGLLGKLPCVQNNTDFQTLVNTPILSYNQIVNNINYITVLLEDSDITPNNISPDISSSNNVFLHNNSSGIVSGHISSYIISSDNISSDIISSNISACNCSDYNSPDLSSSDCCSCDIPSYIYSYDISGHGSVCFPGSSSYSNCLPSSCQSSHSGSHLSSSPSSQSDYRPSSGNTTQSSSPHLLGSPIKGCSGQDGSSGNLSLSISHNILSTTFSRNTHNEPEMRIDEEGKKVKKKNKCIMKIETNDAYQRTLYSVLLLSQKMGRLPEYTEWNNYYERNGWNTEEETTERQRRFNAVIKYVARTFDPSICTRWYTVGEFEDDIKKKITIQELKIICEQMNIRERIKYEHLDVAMGYHWLCMLSNQKKGKELTVPQKGLIMMFRVMKSLGLINVGCNYSQINAIRTGLKRIGYITLLNSDYWWEADTKYSKAMQWGIGENCPRYADFVSFVGEKMVQKVIEQAKKKRSVQKAVQDSPE